MPSRVKDKANREKQAYDFFIQKGLTPIQSAALVGNFIVESGLNTRIEGDRELSTPSVGIAQWRESRLATLRKKYNDPYSFENQLDFVWWELNNTEKEAFDYIKQAETPETAAIAVRQKYERAWAAHDDRRIKFTTDVLNRYSSEEEQGLKHATPQISERGQGQQTIDGTSTQTVNQNLTNLQNTKENINFAFPFPVYEDDEEEEKDPDSKEVSQAKQILNKRKATRDYLTQIVAQNLAYEPVEYVRTNPYQGQPPQMEDGGKVKVIDKDGNEQQMDRGSKEYKEHYNEGDLVLQTGEEDYSTSLPAVELSSRDKQYPYYNTLSDAEREYFNDESPIGRAIRGKAVSGRTVNADDVLAMPGQLLSGAGEALQASQAGLVEGVEYLRGNEYDFERIMPSLTDSNKQQRVPTDVWGIENDYHVPIPELFKSTLPFGHLLPDDINLKTVGNFAMDAFADPSLVTGVGAVGRNVVKRGVRGATKKAIKKTDNFKSEIDWAKWNKDIPSNKPLMDEYNTIEATTKKAGTWMKNPDGSAFKGTPEQFVQQNSSNFKKAYPEGINTVYRGSQAFDPTLSSSMRGNKENQIIFGAGDKNVAEKYATNSGWNLDYMFKDINKKPHFFHPNKNIPNVYSGAMEDVNPGLYQYALPKNVKQIKGDAFHGDWRNVKQDDVLDWMKINRPKEYQTRLDYEHIQDLNPDRVSTDNIAGYMIDKKIPTGVSKNTIDVFGETKGSDIFMHNPERVKVKSLMYNDGMFDMTNPNIYKTVVGGVATTGAATQMEDGGKVNITDAEGNTREVSTSSQEYRDWYDSGDIVIQTGEEDYLTDLPAVYLGSGSNSNKETFSEEELSELLRQRTQDELYNRIIIDERSNQQQPKSTIPNTAPTSFKKEEVVEKEGDVISDPEQFLESLKPRDFHRQEVDISVGNITPTEYKNLSEEEKIKFNKKLSEQGIIKLLDTPKGRAETIEVQRKLVEQGYDLGKFGVKGDGVDGVAGRVTTAAIKKYNEELLKQDFSENYSDFKRANVKYEPLFKNGVKEFTVDTDIKNFQSELQQKGLMTKAIHDFDLNFDIDNLGKKELDSKYNFQISDSKVCKYGEECATFVTMDTLNTVGVKAFEDSNVRGDAWTMNDRIVKAGGKTLFSIFSEDKPNLNSKGEITGYMKTMLGNAPEFDTKTLIPGDVVHLYYENSDFTEKAWKESEGDIPTSHVGIVKKGKDGEVYVEHNVGGTLYVNSIDELMEGTRIGSKKALTQVSGISRPKYNIDLEDKKEYYETSSPYSPNFNNLTNIDSPLLKEDAALYSEAIHRNSEVLQQDLGLSETEFRVLSKAAVTIPWQESYYSREIDTPRAAIGNRNVDTLVKKAGAPVRQALGGREMSRGLSQIKDEENLNEVIRENILQNNEANLYEPKKAAIATFYALGSRYLYLRELAAQNNLPITEDELARLSMLSWNESVTTMGKSLKKYGNYDDIMDAYRTDSKTGEIAGHGYDKAFNVFENMFQLK